MRADVLATIATTLLGILSLPACSDPADDKRLSPAFHACMDKAAGTTGMMRACMSSEQARLEGELNADYRDLMTTMPDGDEKESLRNAERAWVAHRETQCAFEGTQQEGGTLKPVLIAGCWLRETADRVDTLQQRRNFESRR